MHYVYILSLDKKRIYTGTTADLQRRLAEHKNHKVTSTKHIKEIRLIHYEGYLLKSDATRREKFLKTTEGKRLLKQQIRDILNSVTTDSGKGG